MEKRNSLPDFYLGLFEELYRDIADCYGVLGKTQRVELGVIRTRVAREGVGFLTKTLPQLIKTFDKVLAGGGRFAPEGFKRLPGSTIPKFLGWLFNRVLQPNGEELETPCPMAVKHIRQLGHVCYKLEMPYAKETEQSVIEAFVIADAELALLTDGPVPDLVSGGTLDGDAVSSWDDEWIIQARDLTSRVVAPVDPFGIKPKHGPGSVATGEGTAEKTKFSRIYRSLECLYPVTEWMHFNLSHVAQSIDGADGLSKWTYEDFATAKVVLVPKDSRGPRLISCEPLEIQWIQQGLKELLQAQIETSRWTAGQVNFTRQDINRDLALRGSRGEGWVTLDMKEASDRVHLELVKSLFQGHPVLLAALLAARSSRTRLPNGQIVELNKFAPMGSAVCFPVESLVFWALSVCAIKRESGCSWRDARRSVYVYGDDIIVKEKDYTTLLRYLPRVGLKFNESKCCTARFFRESCGCDAYVGVDVTPTRLKSVWSCRRNPRALASYVAFYNAMMGQGYYRTAAYVQANLTLVYGQIPYTDHYSLLPNGSAWVDDGTGQTSGSAVSQSGCPAYAAVEGPALRLNKAAGVRTRVCKNTGRLQVYAWYSEPKKVRAKYDGYAEMLRRTLYPREFKGPHGGVYALPRRNCLKRGWRMG